MNSEDVVFAGTFKGVIFDLDGTLLDSLAGIADSMNLLLGGMGYRTIPREDYKRLVGTGIRALVEMALPEEWHRGCDPPEGKGLALDHLVTDYRDIYAREWPRLTLPYEGVAGLLDFLRLKGVKTAVLSNKMDDFTREMTGRLLDKWDFVEVAGVREGCPPKPDPTAALAIAGRMGLEPGDIVFVGDSEVDMQTAVNAGMFPAGVLWGFRTADELREHGAKALFKHPGHLTRVF